MKQAKKENKTDEHGYYIICRFRVYDEMLFDSFLLKYVKDKCNAELALKTLKELSKLQPGVFILFEGGYPWGSNGNLAYLPLYACQDGRTLQLTTNINYKCNRFKLYDGEHIYTSGNMWEFSPDCTWCNMSKVKVK